MLPLVVQSPLISAAVIADAFPRMIPVSVEAVPVPPCATLRGVVRPEREVISEFAPLRAGVKPRLACFAFNCVWMLLVASMKARVAAETPLVDVGVMAPRAMVNAGVNPPEDDPETPLAEAMETAVTGAAAAIAACTCAVVAIFVVLSVPSWVVAVVPFGRAGVPVSPPAVPLVLKAPVPVRFVTTPEMGVPRAGPAKTGEVRVKPAIVDVLDPLSIAVLPMTMGNPSSGETPTSVHVPAAQL